MLTSTRRCDLPLSGIIPNFLEHASAISQDLRKLFNSGKQGVIIDLEFQLLHSNISFHDLSKTRLSRLLCPEMETFGPKTKTATQAKALGTVESMFEREVLQWCRSGKIAIDLGVGTLEEVVQMGGLNRNAGIWCWGWMECVKSRENWLFEFLGRVSHVNITIQRNQFHTCYTWRWRYF